ncbi:MAG: phage tail protein [Alphaproteobacteria bacterium]|nr:phage tail protein [Alphaproteobacteria bacterium]
MISFNLIPLNIQVPGQYIEIDNSKAVQGLTGMPCKVLLIGQMLAAGTADPLVPYLIGNDDQGNTYFGEGSQLAHMVEKFRKARDTVELWAISQVDNPAGVAAAGAFTFTGPATAAGTLVLYIGGRKVEVAVAAADAAADIATAVAAAITADADLPVTAAVDGGDDTKVNVTARHKGLVANSIDLRANYYQEDALPAGVGVTVTAMTGGTGNPDVGDVIAAIAGTWYTDFGMAYADTANVVLMETELESRFGPLAMKDGHLYYTVADTYANLVTLADGRNSPQDSVVGIKGSPTPPYEITAQVTAVCAYDLQIDPARPVQTLELPDVMAPAVADRFDWSENNILLGYGISTLAITRDDTVQIMRMVTTYKTNAAGAADPSYHDLETMKTLAYLRYDVRTLAALRWPRYKLADDGTTFAAGQAVVTPSVIRSALIARFKLWEENGLVENIEQFKADLIVERNTTDKNRIDTLIPPDVINQFRVLAAQEQFRL